MGKRYLIDTNIITHFLENTLPEKGNIFVSEIIDNEYFISIINKIELLSFAPPKNQKEAIDLFIDNALILDLTHEIADKAAEFRRKYKVKLPDAIIASTVKINNLTLVTGNESDFSKIAKISYINPFKL